MHGCQGDSREHENILFVVYKDADFLGDVKFSYEGSPQFMANQKPNWAVFEFGEKMPIAKCEVRSANVGLGGVGEQGAGGEPGEAGGGLLERVAAGERRGV